VTVQPLAAVPGAAYNGYPVPRRRRYQGLSFLVHGHPKMGKSCFADSGPRPTLILDVEGASFWTPSRKIYWDPMREPVPQPDGSWDSAIVLVRDTRLVDFLLKLLSSGQHPFKSVSVDSATEVQQRLIDSITKGRVMQGDNWQTLLRQVNGVFRAFRDLVTLPVNPLWSVAFTAGTKYDNETGKMRPLLQGQSRDYGPYYVDVEGYVEGQRDGSRQLLIGPHPRYETGERVGGRLPYSMAVGYPGRHGWTIESMLMQVLSPQQTGSR
jgi:hypothetical protein